METGVWRRVFVLVVSASACGSDPPVAPDDAGPRRDGSELRPDGGALPADDAGPPGDAGPSIGATTRYDATHYVSPDATGSGDGSRENPWTWSQAYENAMAGMRVQFAPGMYVSPGNEERSIVFGPRRSGTEAEPIVFFAEYPAVYNDPSMHSLLFIDDAGRGTLTGAAPGTSYVTWDGFAMRQGQNNPFLSEESVWSAWGSDHLRVLRCLFDQQGHGYDEGGANNWGAIFMQGVHHVEIADCIFRNIPGVDENTATYLVYDVGEVEIHHSVFENNWSNFYIKGVQGDAEYDLRPHRIHHNRLTNWTSEMAQLLAIGSGDRQPGTFCDFYQNVFETENGNLQVTYNPVSDDAPRNFRFVNNTFVGDTHAGADIEDEGFHTFYGTIRPGSTSWVDALFQNNVVEIAGAVTDLIHTSAAPVPTMSDLARFAHRYNHYSATFEDDDFFGGGLAAWQTAGQDMGSLRGDVRFRGAASGDYRLADGSPALGASRDVLRLLGGDENAAINMGAYILPDQSDVIGVRSRAETDALP